MYNVCQLNAFYASLIFIISSHIWNVLSAVFIVPSRFGNPCKYLRLILDTCQILKKELVQSLRNTYTFVHNNPHFLIYLKNKVSTVNQQLFTWFPNIIKAKQYTQTKTKLQGAGSAIPSRHLKVEWMDESPNHFTLSDSDEETTNFAIPGTRPKPSYHLYLVRFPELAFPVKLDLVLGAQQRALLPPRAHGCCPLGIPRVYVHDPTAGFLF